MSIVYYKMWQFYYKMRRLLQNATFITNYSVYPNYREEGVGAIPILSKNLTHLPSFHLLTPPPPLKWSFLYIPPIPFFLPSCPPNRLLINHIFSWKTKLKHTVVDITCFFIFQDAKSSLTKYKSVFWKSLMEPIKHLSWSFL